MVEVVVDVLVTAAVATAAVASSSPWPRGLTTMLRKYLIATLFPPYLTNSCNIGGGSLIRLSFVSENPHIRARTGCCRINSSYSRSALPVHLI
ncbi:hypothetical protein BC829DRAFT_386980 [Chytridium lagenaria]|nr:hypothetical protein BC829DRAFT_386980 [Chytridium lagenaria]